MQTEILLSGFGGQGALFAGQLLSYSAMDSGKEVTWIPSYGPEMRGGTANCTVVIADEEIGSPFVQHPAAVVVMNLPSLDKYESILKPGGLLVVMTAPWDDLAAFRTWGYASDETHVVFYHRRTLEWIFDKFGFDELDRRNPRVSVPSVSDSMCSRLNSI